MTGGYYVTCTQSFLTLEDMLKLQGIPTKHASKAKELGISSRVLAAMVGNGISVDVLEVILARLLKALGKWIFCLHCPHEVVAT